MVAGSLRHSYFQELFKAASLDPNGNITLSRTDGMLLARWPYDEAMLGRDLKHSQLYKQLAIARSGHFETTSVTDGVQRLVVYSQVGDLPLVIGVGQSIDGIYAQWRAYAFTIGLLMVMLCAMTVGLGCFLAREMKRRNAAEGTLAMLATTDGLTGLFNRRFFNEAIEREWRRAARERTPLALVMCDADLFKSYNDRNGHQAGDRLLQAIGAAMNQSIRRGTDIAARYGGDEFAILLPSTASEGAATVAEKVRSRLIEVCDQQGIPRSHLSIGIASAVPDRAEDQSSLIAAADRALYLAKELGRDRIEFAPRRPHKPALVAGFEPAQRRLIPPRCGLPLKVIVRQHAKRGALDVIVLAALQRPQERGQPDQAESKRHRHQVDEDVHASLSRCAHAWEAGLAGAASVCAGEPRAQGVQRDQERGAGHGHRRDQRSDETGDRNRYRHGVVDHSKAEVLQHQPVARGARSGERLRPAPAVRRGTPRPPGPAPDPPR